MRTQKSGNYLALTFSSYKRVRPEISRARHGINKRNLTPKEARGKFGETGGLIFFFTHPVRFRLEDHNRLTTRFRGLLRQVKVGKHDVSRLM